MRRLLMLICLPALLITPLAACGTRDKKKGDGTDPKGSMPAVMQAMKPAGPARRAAGRRIAARRVVARLPMVASKAGIKLKDNKVECGYLGPFTCKVGLIDAAAVAVIKKQKDYQKAVILFRRGSSNAHFASLKLLPWARKVDISRTFITNLTPLAALADLEELKGWGIRLPKDPKTAKVVPLDLTPLKNATKLRALDFKGTHVTNTHVLAGKTQLTTLGFYMSEVKDIRFVKGLVNLVELNLYACETGKIDAIAGLTKLKILNLYMTDATEFTALKGLVNLEELQLMHAKISDLSVLAGLTKLKTLSLWSKVKLVGLKHLLGMKQLKSLMLPKTVNPAGLAALKKANPKLRVHLM